MNYWHLQMHPNDLSVNINNTINALKKGFIGIDIGDLTKMYHKSFSEWNDNDIAEYATEVAKQKQLDSSKWDKTIFDFRDQIRNGDIILIRKGQIPIALIEVISDYLFDTAISDILWFRHRRKVKLLSIYSEHINKVPSDKFRTTAPGTLTKVSNHNTEAATNKGIIRWHSHIKRNFRMQKYIELLKNNHQIIFTGAPGTGKTFLAKQIADKMIEGKSDKPIDVLKKAVDTFTPDLEWRNNIDKLLKEFNNKFPKEDINKLNLEDYCIGTGERENFCWWIERGLKSLGYYFPGSARSYLIYYKKAIEGYSKHGFIKDLDDNKAVEAVTKEIYTLVNQDNYTDVLSRLGDGFILKLLGTYHPDKYFPMNGKDHINNVIKLFNIEVSQQANIIDKNKAIYKFYLDQTNDKDITPFDFMGILYSNFNVKEGEMLDDDGKLVLKGEIEFVQFHPSYDYTDFVEGLRPTMKEGTSELGFELKNGIFKSFCKRAKENPNKNFVIIIDEINRAEISKVFGELFFAIDPGYRGEKGKVKTQYANIQTEETSFTDIDDDFFYVPENVFIIGTMNDIDRSVEPFDFAMRRRFAWKEIKVDESLCNIILKDLEESDLATKVITELNSAINDIPTLGNHYHIGPAYFLKLNNYNELGDEKWTALWDNHISILLSEYLRGLPNMEDELAKLKKVYDDA